MGDTIAAERRLLAENEYAPVANSHYPALRGLAREELVELAGWLRSQRARARDIVRERRRIRRGKAEPRGATPETPSERGLSAKKQVFARALGRVNNRIERLRTEAARARNAARLREVLDRRRNAPVHHPDPGQTAGEGMRPRENITDVVRVDPREIGQVSQSVRNAQARRDA
ncbi:hypothetical protein [Siccirubricoccus sp. G192]|uniref:hypothetical protein n=1 Tax=Siccirubricoccus sp. G192 TaxID=2849651 RepID=UPI001C2BF95E|nr:hypothetical protein [Siccirubricoccus sp. G192]MBV1796196.1 hypothetical protein [Siccirubricoccus sp. G192]